VEGVTVLRYMLDTNTVSYFLKQHPVVTQRLLAVPMSSLCISAITEGELLFGICKRPEATRLGRAVREFLRRVTVLPWDSSVTELYGTVRADLESKGRIVSPLDLLIATHAWAVSAVLVSSDKVFGQIEGLTLEDWTQVGVKKSSKSKQNQSEI
jgi:tRNA(fMet)-specific endonuclease VapC